MGKTSRQYKGMDALTGDMIRCFVDRIVCYSDDEFEFHLHFEEDMRLLTELGMIVLPKTANPEHMKSNAEVEFKISSEDMEVLKNIERIKDYGEHGFFPVFGGKL